MERAPICSIGRSAYSRGGGAEPFGVSPVSSWSEAAGRVRSTYSVMRKHKNAEHFPLARGFDMKRETNTRGRGLDRRRENGKTNAAVLQRAVDGLRAAGGGAAAIPGGALKLDGSASIEVGAGPANPGPLLVCGNAGAALRQTGEGGAFVVSDTRNCEHVDHVILEGLRLKGDPGPAEPGSEPTTARTAGQEGR
jgi:hypothetical protein